MIILGIESSCDETAAAIIEGHGNKIKVLSNVVASQINIHKKYGGVIPEVAAREHVLNILPVIDEAIKDANIKETRNKKQETKNNIDAIAVTVGPGLITSLIVGVETAKTLSYVWNKPLIAVNHIEGHIYANFISRNAQRITHNAKTDKIIFPAIVLIVSGGHTSLILMKGHGKYEIIGETRDDAAGEAFDKAAKLLGIGYPGGPAISKFAEKFHHSPNAKNQKPFSLPRPMMDSKNFEFSFSGLKTALFYQLKKDKDWKNSTAAYCHEFQQAVIDVLIAKTIKAAESYKVKTILMGGGVTANSQLRTQMKKMTAENLPQVNFVIPDLSYTTDNAAMIATAGYFKAAANKFSSWEKIRTDSNLALK